MLWLLNVLLFRSVVLDRVMTDDPLTVCAAGEHGRVWQTGSNEEPARRGRRRRRPMAGQAVPPANGGARRAGRASAMLPETCTNALFADSPRREKALRGFKLLYVDKTLL